jgi:hypothetical protein
MPDLLAVNAPALPIRAAFDIQAAREGEDIRPALRIRGQDFEHGLPGDAICAADDGAVGARVGGEGGEAVVDALGVDGLVGCGGWGCHGCGGMGIDREKVGKSCSWGCEMRSELTEVGWRACGFKWVIMAFGRLSAPN